MPCKKCGSGLPIIKGSETQCPYCGARTLYMESVYSLKHYLSEILSLSLSKNEKPVKNSELERRKSSIESYFYSLNSDFNEYRHLIITKLDDIEINPFRLFNSIRSAGNLEVIIEYYLIPYIKDNKIKKKFEDFRHNSYIINKSLLGLYYSFLAKNSVYPERCANYYHFVEVNYQNIVDYCNIVHLENDNNQIYEKKEIYIILTEFAAILRKLLNNNPKYYSDKLESLLNKLIEVKADNFQKINLYNQIENIYRLERNTLEVLDKIKIDCPLLSTDTLEESIIFNKENNLEKLNTVGNWIKRASEQYQKYQRNLLKLHSGKLINYLESYRTEFINYKNKNLRKFNILLEAMISKAFEAYISEAVELLNSLSDFLQDITHFEKIIEKFDSEHKNLVQLDELLESFIKEIFENLLLQNSESEYYDKFQSIISVKHSEFDKIILKSINYMLQEFEELRNKQNLSLKEQKNQFGLKFKPYLQKLIDISFDLDEKTIPYPIFIDLNVQNKKLKLDHPENISVIIENPNLSEIKDIKIYFFMSDSFESKLEYTRIKRLKANEMTKIKTKIIPKKKGKFLYMVMAEYQHINKTFWMPSIKLKLKVEKAEEIIPYNYHQTVNHGIYQTDLNIIEYYSL
ncbi:MAG: hypothetical protein ACFFCV_08495 [Promethearchaeota archaeon]